MSAGELETAALVLRTMNPGGSESRSPGGKADAVVAALAGALRSRGLEVELGLGHSHFRCDLAIKRPEEAVFRLALFVDTEAYYRDRDVLERDVLRPRLLRTFGWRVLHVLAKDWYEDADAVLARIERRIEGAARDAPGAAEAAAEEAEPLSDRDVWLEKGVAPPPAPPAPRLDTLGTAPVAPSAAASAEPPPPPAAAPSPPAVPPISRLLAGQTRYFEFIGGTSRKYWHVTVSGADLVVSFGRLGTAGQVKRRAWPTEAEARREAEALIREKLGKGYQEVPPA